MLKYPDGATESINLACVEWRFARKSSKNYYYPSNPPPKFVPVAHQRSKSLKFSRSSKHKLKAFADDLTIISIDKDKHRDALQHLDFCALDLDLEIRADKCYSLLISSGKCTRGYNVALHSGHTQDLSSSSVGTKFLGRVVAGTERLTKSLASSNLSRKFNSSLNLLDSRPI